MPKKLAKGVGTFREIAAVENRRKFCSICGKSYEDVKQMDRHHVNYDRDEWIALCQACHTKVHNRSGFFDSLNPL